MSHNKRRGAARFEAASARANNMHAAKKGDNAPLVAGGADADTAPDASANPLKVTSFNGVKVYNCTAGKTLPQWFAEFKGTEGKLRYNEQFRRRIEIIQDFEMPRAATRVKFSPDGRFVAATGVYRPRVKFYELSQLSLKVERCADAEYQQFQYLTDDCSKMAFLRQDRVVEVHAPAGLHHKLRVPRHGRDMMYHRPTCDLYVAGSGSDVWRLNLEQGAFVAPLTTALPNINVCGTNPQHPILAFGGDNGKIECWDPRDRTRAAVLDLPSSVLASYPAVARAFATAASNASLGSEETLGVHSLRFDDSGLRLAVGTSSGHALVYDIRAGAPYLCKDHRYGLPVHSIKWLDEHLLSADKRVIKLWEKETGAAHTTITSDADINDVAVYKDSGIIVSACESQRIQIHYAPSVGAVPDWCAHLEALTEELEEASETSVFDDYKFVTREQLQDWGLSHLEGSNLLRPYMHGYFMDARLYDQVKAVADAGAGGAGAGAGYDGYVAEQVAKVIADKTKGRIALQSALPAVNQDFAQALLQRKLAAEDGTVDEKSGRRGKKAREEAAEAASVLSDSRFASLFEDEDFAIQQDSEEFKRVNPTAAAEHRKVVVAQTELRAAKRSASTMDSAAMAALGVEASELTGVAKRSKEAAKGQRGMLEDSDVSEDDDSDDEDRDSRGRRAKTALAGVADVVAAKAAAKAAADASRLKVLAPGQVKWVGDVDERISKAKGQEDEAAAEASRRRREEKIAAAMRREREALDDDYSPAATAAGGAGAGAGAGSAFAVRAGMAMGDVLARAQASQRMASFAHLPLADRLKAEERERKRVQAERESEAARALREAEAAKKKADDIARGIEPGTRRSLSQVLNNKVNKGPMPRHIKARNDHFKNKSRK